MATRQFADLSTYRRNVSNAQAGANLLDSLIQGVQGGIGLVQLPAKLQEQRLAQELQNAINQQKLFDMQNPEAALARELQKFAQTTALKEQITNPNSGISQSLIPGEVIGVPSTIPQTAIGLDQAIAANPGMAIPSAAPRLPITPIPLTNLSIDQNIPLEAEERALDAKIKLAQSRPYNQILTKDGYWADPRLATLSNALLPNDPNSNLAQVRKTDIEAAAEAKISAQERLLGRKLEADEAKQIRDQEFRASESEKDRSNRLTLADKRQKLADPASAQANSQKYSDIVASIDDLDKDIGLDTVGFADWFKAVPTTPAKSFATRLEALKSAIALGELAAMKAASKTGGSGLGAVSNFELKTLQSAKGALDQSVRPEEFREQLKKVRDSYVRLQEITNTIESQTTPTAAPSSTPVAPPKGSKVGRFTVD